MRNKYTFKKDDNCIALYKVVKNKDKESKKFGEETEVSLGYYSSVDQLLKKLYHLELIEKGTLAELLADCFSVQKELKEWTQQFKEPENENSNKCNLDGVF